MPAPSPGSRVVLVTGASSGIGRECALAFAGLGDTVVGVARHEPALQELAEERPGIHVEVCDVTDAQARVELTRLVLPAMRGRGDGAIVMISSVAAWASIPPVTAYASSKFALDGLVEGLRRETWGTGVRVHSINPAPISTDYLARSADRSPQPGDPPRPAAPGFPASWVADAVLVAAAAPRPVTRSVPRIAGLVRLAQVPLVGAVLDQVFGRFGSLVTERVRGLVDQQTRGVPSTRG